MCLDEERSRGDPSSGRTRSVRKPTPPPLGVGNFARRTLLLQLSSQPGEYVRALAILTILPLVLTTPALAQMRNRSSSNRPVQTRGPGFLDSQVAKADPP